MQIKIIADENIPLKAVQNLRKNGTEIISISENSPGISDEEIIKIAQQNGGYILTFDKDFGELVFRSRHIIDGVILLRIEPKSLDYVLEKIKTALFIIKNDPQMNFIVVNDMNIRMRKIVFK
ncbi:MAG: DUF5615 family PIN-like protein [Spirochaetota bacterium]